MKVKKDQNGNTDVTLKADHLAQPGMLTPPSTVYEVWFQARRIQSLKPRPTESGNKT